MLYIFQGSVYLRVGDLLAIFSCGLTGYKVGEEVIGGGLGWGIGVCVRTRMHIFHGITKDVRYIFHGMSNDTMENVIMGDPITQ